MLTIDCTPGARAEIIPTIIFSGLTSLNNRGVEALLVSSTAELQRRIPDASIQVLHRPVDKEPARLRGSGLVFVGEHDRARGVRATVSRLRAGSKAGDGAGNLLCRADLVIASGGDTFSHHYPGMHGHLRKLERALHAGVPVYFMGLSVGPFSMQADTDAWTAAARRASLITVREEISYDYVVGRLGIPAALVERTADPAFLLETPDPDALDRLRAAHGMSGDVAFVGIAPSQSIARLAGIDPERHIAAWVAVVRYLLDDLGVHVLVVPHAHGRNAEADDRVIAQELTRRIGSDKRVTVVDGSEVGAVAYKGLLAGCQLVVAERMHAAIAGLSSSVPTVAIGYSTKAAGIIRQVMGAGLDDRVLLSVERFTDGDQAPTFVAAAWDDRAIFAERLRERLPEIKRLAGRNFDAVVTLMARS